MKLAMLALMGTLAFAQAGKDAKKPAPAPAPKAAPAPKETPSAGGFVANKESGVIHKADCKMAANMKAENKATFGSKAEAQKGGFTKTCKVCKP